MLAIGLAFAIQATIAKPYQIPTDSMEPTIQGGQPVPGTNQTSGGDRIIANRLIYKLRDIERGDIVVFDQTPAAQATCRLGDPDVPFVKRVIGLPGDTVEVVGGETLVNGQASTVERARMPNYTFGPVTVPADNVLVLGDNRNESCDSHLWEIDGEPAPFLPEDNVIGQAEVIYWPLNHLDFLN